MNKLEQARQKRIQAKMDKIEIVIGNLLRAGVIISAVIMIIGFALLIITGGTGYPAGYHPHDFKQIFAGVIAFKPYAIMMLGIFCLILTPVLRVLVSIYSFYKEHDMLYVYITTFVMFVLAFSFWLGIHK
ncbi:DUF1634 domain-containing protein [Acetilactobacillus jinshanensis]|uniref:DUF1634 domain-containing protein n=1 Tax=Acetilactobacillus jinshanensis TaxID=1720083 RepID=A0A4V1ALJ4_9LACO|nr:DUF1634 domain-containing protein [Acetilactobacillus jinshanensis]QBP17809.1 DUF1634 domain-containing protein [Acetilactobacillus jinshanensis]URL60671.1 DUF1634 domain-containing protein [uncultured bacterium]